MTVTTLDRVAMLRRVDGDPDILRSLVEIFFDSYPAQLQELELAVRSGNLEDAERIAHSLKGSLQLFFKGELPMATFALEDASRSGVATLAQEKLATLNLAFINAEPCLAELREYLE